MMEERIWLICQILLFVLPFITSYRLNVPRVLLPYHPEIQVSFELIVTDPEGGCFRWRSTRSDIVSVKMTAVKGDCSDRAMIYATSKHESEQTAMIFAEDKDSGIVLSCGVAVDIIKKIIISTTTKVLFLDAGPSDMVIQAKNSEGDMFSNLGGIPFEWELQSTSSKRPLRVVPFAQSKYEAPDGIRYLEENKKRGYVVLVEGMQTGTAVLKAKLSEPFFKANDVPSHEIVLLVVANLLLVPSSDLYLPVGAVVHYSAQIVKQGTTEPISLPSVQYQLEVADSSICSLSENMSSVVTVALGNTDISLIDKNVKSNVALKPPSVHIYVVEPSAISFSISGDSWYLEAGKQYAIVVQAFDMKDNQLYISDNVIFNTHIPSVYFTVLSNSRNGTFFEVKAIKSGVAKLRSQLVSVELPDGSENKFASGLSCEQLVTISDPLTIKPNVIVFPYIGENLHHSLPIKASGGTGIYAWSTANSTVALVDSSGFVTSGAVGNTEVLANDVKNNLHSAVASVKVLPPVKISFAESQLEALVDSVLELAISMYVEHDKKLLPVAVCDCVKFLITLSDKSVFEVYDDKLLPPNEKSPAEACALLPLKALSAGDVTVNVTFEGVSAIAYVSSFNKLQLKLAEEVLLTPGSEIVVDYSGGPRPWILDRSKYFAKFEYSDVTKLVEHAYTNNQLHISCLESTGDLNVRIRVGNERTLTNPRPAVDTAQLRICCVTPSRMEIGIESSGKNTETCPKTSSVLYIKRKSVLFLKAYGICVSGPTMGTERPFDSLSGLQIKWSVDQKKLLKIEGFKNDLVMEKSFATAIPYGLPGYCSIKAEVDNFVVNGKKKRIEQRLSTQFDLSLMGRAKIDADEIVLWNEKDNIRVVHIIGGSGHFDIIHDFDDTVVDVRLKGNNVEIIPLRTGKTTISFIDLCFGNQFEGAVTVTDLDHISIKTLKAAEIYNEFPLTVRVEGSEGIVFTLDDVAAIDVKIDILPEILSVVRTDSLSYRIVGKSTGTAMVKASARSAAGKIIYSLPHEIQIFSPINIVPKLVTLIPESVFQFEIIGGPQPKPAFDFVLNDTSIALVNVDGLITSKKLGFTSVSVSLNMNNAFSKDSAVIKVVSLAGIKIVISSQMIDKGGKVWARVEGIGSDESPFAFCGALYPLHVTWSLGSHGVAEVMSPLGMSVSESPENYYQVYLLAVGPGQTELKAKVVVSSEAPSFTSTQLVFQESITITVSEPLRLLNPVLTPSSIIIAPGSALELKPNRANGSVIFNVPSEFKNIVKFNDGGSSVLHGVDVGEAVLEMRDSSALLNRTAFVGISVVNPHSLLLELRDAIPLTQDGRILRALPLGFRVAIRAGKRDHYGRLVQASSVKVCCRPHRFDLTEINIINAELIEVALKRAGETTLMVWDEGNINMNAFLRIPVAPVISPASVGILLYDVTCFKSLLPDPKWTEVSSRKHFRFVDVDFGIAVSDKIGTAIISATFSDNQTTFSEISIHQPENVYFGDVPEFITNVGQQQYVFPVFLRSATGSTNVHGCDPSDVKKLDGLKAPFDCSLYFKRESPLSAQKLFFARSVYSAATNSYACLVEKLPVEYNGGLIRDVEGEVVLKVTLSVFGKDYKAEAHTHFYPCFEIDERELRLDNVNTESFVTIRVTDSVASYMIVDTCAGDVLQVNKKKANTEQTLLYSVKLNVYSSSLWQDYLKECNITIRNTLTGQIEEISVKIAVHNDAGNTLINGSEGVLIQLYNKATLYLTAIGTIVITLLTLFAFFAWYKGYYFWSSLFAPVYKPQPGVNGVFASDRSPAGLGYMAHLRYVKQPSALIDRDRYSAQASNTTDLLFSGSPRFSSLNRSAGSSGDSFLWKRDTPRSPAQREKSL